MTSFPQSRKEFFTALSSQNLGMSYDFSDDVDDLSHLVDVDDIVNAYVGCALF